MDSSAPLQAADESEHCWFSTTSTDDAYDHARSLQHWNQTYEQLSAGRFRGELEEVWFGNVQVFRERTNQIVHECGLPWEGSRTFGIPVEAQGQGWFRGEVFDQDAMLTFMGGEELDFRTPRLLDILAVTVDTTVLSDYALRIEGRDLEAEIGQQRLIRGVPHNKASELRAFVQTVLETAKTTPHILRHAAMRKSLEQALYGSLIDVFGNCSERGRPAPTGETRRQIVDRAREYMRSHIDEPITVTDLCTVLNVSRRTLQYSFQDVLNLNPVSFLRAMRLNGVRRALRQCEGVKSVADIAASWGFWHLSHFAADYKAMFGELPSETLRASSSRRGAHVGNG
jgi:AraC family ethanolamine operon transcriptional activator